mmetsp:Transcript_7008/g.16021  ORF Transcript_7008/g.16021 Transcript_7008/m.16021 type:complete len:568 (+) Transcript_7008:355-2058(+)|eukprot:CAMPEP_0172613112 /NCGR_PEP_ID=MMETSP1068-20121228/40472_1 /TAXON_ID=35684 /ORGANISM="Pseudopedinella elastica, Strain CCMP716" /LENGTH=567 /DNA_ID=CAMNT_0013417477 /DNA_START=355 /DNA_END=2058 /DNA_ORIENTATION=+
MDAEYRPYALLDRAQSARVTCVPVGEALAQLMARKVEAPPYEELINFPRAKDKDEIRCVMCGLPPGINCVIPRQNKDVCKECDKSTWKHVSSNVFFKWCKGCKKFLRIGSFSEKMDAAKCDRCRERGRQSYLLKKGKDGGVVCLLGGNRSRSNSMSSNKSDFETELNDTMSLVSAAAAIASVSRTPIPPGSLDCADRSLDGSRDGLAARLISSSDPSSDEERLIHEGLPGAEKGRKRACSVSHLSRIGGLMGGRGRRCRSLSPVAIHGSADDVLDTMESARAVAAFSAQVSRSEVSEVEGAMPFSNQATTDKWGPVVDDLSSTCRGAPLLSTVFGKPLRELKRSNELSASNEPGTTPPLSTSTREETREESREETREESREGPQPKQSPEGVEGEGPIATEAAASTLYELACIHQRIVTLEEHAAKVKSLEQTVEAQRSEMDGLRGEALRLRDELADALDREAALQAECEALEARLKKGRKRPNPDEDEEEEEGCIAQEDAQGNASGEVKGADSSHAAEVTSTSEEVSEEDENSCLEDAAATRAHALISQAISRRAQKQPRCISFGD